jgi:hypothetical protein
MPRIDLLRFMLCGATVSFALSIGEPAQACPPGMMPVSGNATPGEISLGPGGKCVPGPSYGNISNEVQLMQRGRPSYLPPRDREGEKLEAEVRSLEVNALKQARLLMDPDYIRYLTGKWMLFPSPEGKPKGEYCSAFFSREGVILTMAGPGGDYKGALLQFMSADIPRPEKQEVVQVTLTQNDVPPITFKALNQSSPNVPFGSIIVPITTMDALLTGMKDVQNLDLQIDGKSIAKINWHSGLAVRDELGKCLKGEPYSVTQIDLIGK